MPNWTRLTAPAAGAFSATWITRIGGLVFAVILGGAFLVQSCFSMVPTDPESLREPEGIAGDRATRQLGQRVQDIENRAALDAAAAGRQLAATGAQLTGGHVTPAFDPTTGETLPDGAAGPIAALTEDEAQLREILRLEAIERRTRSLRSAPVVMTYRRPESGGLAPAAATAAAEPTADAPAEADAPTDDRASTPIPPQPVSLLDTISALQALDAQQTAGAELDAGRRATRSTPPSSTRRTTRQDGSGSMRARLSKPHSSTSSTATFPARSSRPWPCRSTRSTDSGL